mmetsp:Transcript_29749/g.88984  ORF Transcript_29749/g.88984 Transcript_29749/m.88984 type:complete len:212 (+) Transcript_29749:498-1133(+)
MKLVTDPVRALMASRSSRSAPPVGSSLTAPGRASDLVTGQGDALTSPSAGNPLRGAATRDCGRGVSSASPGKAEASIGALVPPHSWSSASESGDGIMLPAGACADSLDGSCLRGAADGGSSSILLSARRSGPLAASSGARGELASPTSVPAGNSASSSCRCRAFPSSLLSVMPVSFSEAAAASGTSSCIERNGASPCRDVAKAMLKRMVPA